MKIINLVRGVVTCLVVAPLCLVFVANLLAFKAGIDLPDNFNNDSFVFICLFVAWVTFDFLVFHE